MSRLIGMSALAVIVAACTPTPGPGPMPPDATDGGTCAAACAALADAGCPEGKSANCAAILNEVQVNRLVKNPETRMPLTCSDQLTPAVLSALGWCK